MKNLKKITSIVAVVLLSVGMFSSCTEDNTIEETDALYENVIDINSSGDEQKEVDNRD